MAGGLEGGSGGMSKGREDRATLAVVGFVGEVREQDKPNRTTSGPAGWVMQTGGQRLCL